MGNEQSRVASPLLHFQYFAFVLGAEEVVEALEALTGGTVPCCGDFTFLFEHAYFGLQAVAAAVDAQHEQVESECAQDGLPARALAFLGGALCCLFLQRHLGAIECHRIV